MSEQRTNSGVTMHDTRAAHTDTDRVDHALHALVRLYRAGGTVSFRGQTPRVDVNDSRIHQDIHAHADDVRRIITGPRKDWARDRREAAVTLSVQDAGPNGVGVAVLDQRRTLLRAHEFQLPKDSAMIAEALADVNGIVLQRRGFPARAATGHLLAASGLDTPEMVEIDPDAARDYRDFLAGSFWIDLDRASIRDDLLASAIVLALQARSVRRDGPVLQPRKPALYLAAATRALRTNGHSPHAIAARLGIPEHLVRRWTDRDSAGASNTTSNSTRRSNHADAHAATPKQVAKIRHQLTDCPALQAVLPDTWQTDRQRASEFITLADRLAGDIKPDIHNLTAERRARQYLAGGAALAEAAEAAGLQRDDLIARLGRNVQDMEYEILHRASVHLGFMPAPTDIGLSGDDHVDE